MWDSHRLFEEYSERFSRKNLIKTPKLFSIGFIGITGVGKSYVAELLSDKTGILITRNDNIRRFLNEKGIEKVNTGEENFTIMQYIAENTSVFLYQNNISHILDQDIIRFYEKAKNISERNGAKFILVKLVCPEDILLKRLSLRTEKIEEGDTTNDSRVGIEEYEKRKIVHESVDVPNEMIFMTINTGSNVESQVDDLITSLKVDGFL